MKIGSLRFLLIIGIIFTSFAIFSGNALAQVCIGDNGSDGACEFGWCSDGENIGDSGDDCDMGDVCCGTIGGGNTGGNTGATSGVPVDLIPEGLGLPDPGLTSGDQSGIEVILLALLNWLLIIFLIVSLIAFIITGLMYLLAMGNSRTVLMENAKNYFYYAVIALLVTGSGLIIVNVINNFLNASL